MDGVAEPATAGFLLDRVQAERVVNALANSLTSEIRLKLMNMINKGELDELCGIGTRGLWEDIYRLRWERNQLEKKVEALERGCPGCGARRASFEKRPELMSIVLCSACVDHIVRGAVSLYEERFGCEEDERDEAAGARSVFVYFARSLLGGELIKIGRSVNVAQRMADLKAEAVLILDDGEWLETELHEQFAAHRVIGEWFKPHPDLLAYIEERSDDDVRLGVDADASGTLAAAR